MGPWDAISLEAWTSPILDKGVENLLLNFSSPDIPDAARSMPERDLSLREDSRRRLAAYLGDTTVDIDLEQQTIIHRFEIWSRTVSEKRFCPHVARVFLMVDSERARGLLSLIQSGLAKLEVLVKARCRVPPSMKRAS